jgi:hypothetical protein
VVASADNVSAVMPACKGSVCKKPTNSLTEIFVFVERSAFSTAHGFYEIKRQKGIRGMSWR